MQRSTYIYIGPFGVLAIVAFLYWVMPEVIVGIFSQTFGQVLIVAVLAVMAVLLIGWLFARKSKYQPQQPRRNPRKR